MSVPISDGMLPVLGIWLPPVEQIFSDSDSNKKTIPILGMSDGNCYDKNFQIKSLKTNLDILQEYP